MIFTCLFEQRSWWYYFQPIFLIGIAGMVLIIALAIYLPYFSLGDVASPY